MCKFAARSKINGSPYYTSMDCIGAGRTRRSERIGNTEKDYVGKVGPGTTTNVEIKEMIASRLSKYKK